LIYLLKEKIRIFIYAFLKDLTLLNNNFFYVHITYEDL
jgi:hypothetical protein